MSPLKKNSKNSDIFKGDFLRGQPHFGTKESTDRADFIFSKSWSKNFLKWFLFSKIIGKNIRKIKFMLFWPFFSDVELKFYTF